MSTTEQPGRILLEVCVDSVDDAILAEAHGADRIELNSALSLGGLTPSAGLLLECLEQVSIPVIVMCRPRSGGFCYSSGEVRTMFRDTEWMLNAGAAGVAFGFLTDAGEIDRALTKQMRERTVEKVAVFHRAFDLVPDPATALETLIEFRIDRVLTSGGASTMLQGLDTIQRLQQQAGDRIEILPGSGLNAAQIENFLAQTGCRQVHGSLGMVEIDATVPDQPRLTFVDAKVIDERRRVRTSADRVHEMRRCLDAISARSSKS